MTPHPTIAEVKRREAKRQVIICAVNAHTIAVNDPKNGAAQQAALDPAHAAIDSAIHAAKVEVAEEAYAIYDALALVTDNPKIEPALREFRERIAKETT